MNISDLNGKTVAFASSGGLDSCTVTKWLKEHNVNVVSMTGDLGQPDEVNMDEIRERMLQCGASDAIFIDLKEELAKAGLQMLQGRGTYEGGYWNTTGIARHVTVKGLVKAMNDRGISILAHGATGRGNDQVRFSLVSNMLDPKVEVYAPWRDNQFIEAFGGRKEMIEYCEKHDIPVKATLDKPYSTDSNLLGLTHEAGKLEYLDTPCDFVEPLMGVFPEKAPDQAELFEVTFKEGCPVSINGQSLNLVNIFTEANRLGGKHGIGIGIHTIENRFVGIKSRGVYESPGLVLLSQCFEFLLEQILDRRGRRIYEDLSSYLSEQIYQGYFYDLGSQMALSGLNPLTRLASGTVEVKMYKGNIHFSKASATPHSLYDPELSSMEAVGDFDHQDSEGFIRVLGVNAKAINVKGQVNEPGFQS